MREKRLPTLLAVLILALLASAFTAPAFGFGGISSDNTTALDGSGTEYSEWRRGFSASGFGVGIEPETVLEPDSPYVVGVSTLGAGNSPDSLLVESRISPLSVSKSEDIDSDGDPDTVHINLELLGLNEGGSSYSWDGGDGDEVPRWTLAPKTRGMDGKSPRIVRPPPPVIRIEENDTVFLSVENSHHLSHSLVVDGVDVLNDAAQRSTVRPGGSGSYILRPTETGVFSFRSEENPADTSMGLAGMIVVEKNQSQNRLQTLNVGGGKLRVPSQTVGEYDGEYDLIYGQRYDGASKAAARYRKPDRVVRRTTEATRGKPDDLTLNGRTYPDTVHDSLIVAETGDTYVLNMLNTGSERLTVRTDAGNLSVRQGDGGYKDVDALELEPQQTVRTRLEVGALKGIEPLYVEEGGLYTDDSPTTFVAPEPALGDSYLPEDIPVESSAGLAETVGVSALAASVGFVAGIVSFVSASALRKKRKDRYSRR